MKIVLKKSGALDDWYTIERAHHENRQWLEPTGPNSMRLMYSGRISDACVEGTAAEMLEIAKAIKARGSASFKRCAVPSRSDNDPIECRLTKPPAPSQSDRAVR